MCVVLSSPIFVFFWKDDDVEVVWANKRPFIATSYFVEASDYDQEFGPIKFKGKKKDGAPWKIYMELRDDGEILEQAVKLLKIADIMSFRLVKGPIT